MTIKKKLESIERSIDLTGPNGNAYCLLATANDYARQLGIDQKKVQEEMKAGDYENLVEVFEKYFGDFVTLYR